PTTVAVETPLQDDVRELVSLLNAHLLPSSPIEFQWKMTVDEMAGEDTTVFVARTEDGRAVGMGALKMAGDGLAEVKRMFTRPEVRGQRVGSALLAAITDLARQKGVAKLLLETGTGPAFAAAYRLYENSGFAVRGAFFDYPESEWSRFYEKSLRPAASA
ncbi:MAG: GNAT family N-acetyltransferase, partial [Devosia sp.]